MVNIVLVLVVPVGMYRTGIYTSIKMPTFRTGLNIGRTGHVSTDFGHYRLVPKKKKLFLFFSFVIFEFL